MVHINIPDSERLTGRIRLRRGRLGRVIPEVEVQVIKGRIPQPPGRPEPEPEVIGVRWRDARKYEMDTLCRFFYRAEPPEPPKP